MWTVNHPLSKALLFVAALAISAVRSEASFIVPAAILAPGDVHVVPFTASSPGTLLSSLISPFSFSTTGGVTSGTVFSAVFQNASGTLDFYYQIRNNGSSATALSREFDGSFTGFGTAVAFRLDGSSLPGGIFTNGTDLNITADRGASGTTIGFNFVSAPPGIAPGITSAVLVISTDATSFGAGNVGVLDGGSQTVTSFAPTSAPIGGTPEPSSVILMSSGLVGFAIALRRFRERRSGNSPATAVDLC